MTTVHLPGAITADRPVFSSSRPRAPLRVLQRVLLLVDARMLSGPPNEHRTSFPWLLTSITIVSHLLVGFGWPGHPVTPTAHERLDTEHAGLALPP